MQLIIFLYHFSDFMTKCVIQGIVLVASKVCIFFIVGGSILIKKGKDFLEEGSSIEREDGGQTVIIESFLDLEKQLFLRFSHTNNKI